MPMETNKERLAEEELYFKDDHDLSWTGSFTIPAADSNLTILLWKWLAGRYASSCVVKCSEPFYARPLIGQTCMRIQRRLPADVALPFGNGGELWEIEITPTTRPATVTVEAVADYHNTPQQEKYRSGRRIGTIQKFVEFITDIPSRLKGSRVKTHIHPVLTYNKRRLVQREELRRIPRKKRFVQ